MNRGLPDGQASTKALAGATGAWQAVEFGLGCANPRFSGGDASFDLAMIDRGERVALDRLIVEPIHFGKARDQRRYTATEQSFDEPPRLIADIRLAVLEVKSVGFFYDVGGITD